uniref:Regulatory factor X-associated protein n=1 Tax=Astyanax mexicanus TaxID=7994 RepID=A0A8B9J5N5_ASTMX
MSESEATAPAAGGTEAPGSLAGEKSGSLSAVDTLYSYDADDPGEESDALDAPEPRESGASPAETMEDEALGGENAPKKCVYVGCTETTKQVAKQRKPWMCKKHRNKMYKDKYKKKKSDQAIMSQNAVNTAVTPIVKLKITKRPVSVTKQRLGTMGERPARPSLIEQVLNQKRLVTLKPSELKQHLETKHPTLVAKPVEYFQQKHDGLQLQKTPKQ